MLTQEAAYQSLLTHTRRQMHLQIAQELEARFPATAQLQPEVLAQHYTKAGLAEEAAGYWQRAGERSNAQSAYMEAVAHLTKGLEVLTMLPGTPTRVQQELDMQIALGRAFTVTKGFAAPETGQAFARARELCHRVEDAPRRFAVLAGVRDFYLNRGEHQTAMELDKELLTLAQRQPDPGHLAYAHTELGVSLYFLGEPVPARVHFEQALALYSLQQFNSLPLNTQEWVPCLAYTAFTLWILGYPEQALMRCHEMLTLAQEWLHPYSLARALYYAAWFHGVRREWSTVQERAEISLALSTEQGFVHWVGNATFEQGFALAMQGQGEVGIAQMRQGLAANRASGVVVGLSWRLARLAKAYREIGQVEEGLRLLAEALAYMDRTGERYCEAEAYRIKGELLLRQAVPDASQAEPASSTPHHCPLPAGQIVGATGRYEPEPAVAASGPAYRSPGAPGPALWLVHRGV